MVDNLESIIVKSWKRQNQDCNYLISNKTKKYVEGGAAHMGKLISSGKTQIISFSLPVEMNEFYIEGLTDCKIYSFNFFCQQILLGLKNNVLNNWRVMVKIRPSTEEIEMHDLYSKDYGLMNQDSDIRPKS